MCWMVLTFTSSKPFRTNWKRSGTVTEKRLNCLVHGRRSMKSRNERICPRWFVGKEISPWSRKTDGKSLKNWFCEHVPPQIIIFPLNLLKNAVCHILKYFTVWSLVSSNGDVPTEWRRFGPRRCCNSDFGDWAVSVCFNFNSVHSVDFKSNLQQSLSALFEGSRIE